MKLNKYLDTVQENAELEALRLYCVDMCEAYPKTTMQVTMTFNTAVQLMNDEITTDCIGAYNILTALKSLYLDNPSEPAFNSPLNF